MKRNHPIPASWDESDAFGRWRRYLRFKPGQRRREKRSYWKRARRAMQKENV